MQQHNLNHLRELESESIFIIREVAAQFERPGLLFSGGKDSIVMVHLAKKAFFPARIPFPLVHIDKFLTEDQAKAGPLFFWGAGHGYIAFKLEEIFQLVFWHPDSRIFDWNGQFTIFLLTENPNISTLGSEFNGIIN